MRERASASSWTAWTARSATARGLRPEALAVTFAGANIAELVALPLDRAGRRAAPAATRTDFEAAYESTESGETDRGRDDDRRRPGGPHPGARRPRPRLPRRSNRRTPTVSPGELQRLRLATQLRAGLFGVLYVLDEPSAGLHPADAEPLLDVLDRLRRAGNSLFVVEHDMDVVRRADWIVDVGPGAGELGGEVLYSGPVRRPRRRGRVGHPRLPVRRPAAGRRRAPAQPSGSLALRGITLPQPAGSRRRHPARRVHRGHRGVRIRQVDAGLQGARRRRHAATRRWRSRLGGRRRRRRHGGRRPRSRCEHRRDGGRG